MSDWNRSQAPAPAAVRDFRFPRIHRTQLSNGLALFAVPHGDIPVVTFRLVVHAGAEHDTTDSAGLAYLTARALEAGTRSRSVDRLAWDFEKLGAELDIEVVWDAAALVVTVPSDRAEAAVALLAEVALDPALLPDEIDRLKNEQLAELLQREAEPRALANDAASRAIFAPKVPYHLPIAGVRETVRQLDATAVQRAYAAHWRPNNAALLAVGAVDLNHLADLGARYFSDWSGMANSAPLQIRAAGNSTRVHLVHRSGSVQSEIRIGHIGVERTHPDYYALVVANNILGGAFTSRLNMNLREKNGFTYGVRSGFAFRKRPGPFLIQTAVATDVTVRALQEVWNETAGLLQDGPTEKEIADARDYLSGTVPLELQTTEQIAARASEIFVFNLPEDYYALYRDELRRVTADQAWAAARRHIRLNDLITTIVGDSHVLKEDVEALKLGAIEVHELNA